MGTEEGTRSYTVEEYLNYEASMGGRAEYRNGKIIEKTWGSNTHIQIAHSLMFYLHLVLKGKQCIVFGSVKKVNVEQANSFFYSDLYVEHSTSDPLQVEGDFLTAPVLIAEVLSESNAIDVIFQKFLTYQQLPSLVDYIWVDEYSPFVNVLHRNEGGDWQIKSYSGLKDLVEFQSLGVKIRMADIYRNVVFPPNHRHIIFS